MYEKDYVNAESKLAYLWSSVYQIVYGLTLQINSC